MMKTHESTTYHFERRVLRLKEISASLAKNLKNVITNCFVLEKVTVKNQCVCIYVPFQQSLAVRKRVVGILNALSKDRFYTIDDIEELSTVVLLTNIPYDVSDKTMDLLIEGFGTTLSKFFFFKWQTLSHSKYGWVSFEEIQSAESCIAQLHTYKISGEDRIYCCILPERITSLAMVTRRATTVQLEGVSRKQRKIEKLEEILKVVCPSISAEALAIRGRNLKNGDDTKGYSAIVQWPSFHYATSCLNFFESFEHAAEYSKISACIALPDTYIIETPISIPATISAEGISEDAHPKKISSVSQPKVKASLKPAVESQATDIHHHRQQQQVTNNITNFIPPQQPQLQPLPLPHQILHQQQNVEITTSTPAPITPHQLLLPTPSTPTIPTTITTPSNYDIVNYQHQQHQQRPQLRNPFFRSVYAPPSPPMSPPVYPPMYVQHPRNIFPYQHQQQQYLQHQQQHHKQHHQHKQYFQHQQLAMMNQQQTPLVQHPPHQIVGNLPVPPPLMQQDLSGFVMRYPGLIPPPPVQHPQEMPPNHPIRYISPLMQQESPIAHHPCIPPQHYTLTMPSPLCHSIDLPRSQNTNNFHNLMIPGDHKTFQSHSPTHTKVLNKAVGESPTKMETKIPSGYAQSSNKTYVESQNESHSDIRKALNKIITDNNTIERNNYISTPPVDSNTSSSANHAWKNAKSSKRWSVTKKFTTTKNALLLTEEEKDEKKKKENIEDGCHWNKNPISQLFADETFSIKPLGSTTPKHEKKLTLSSLSPSPSQPSVTDQTSFFSDRKQLDSPRSPNELLMTTEILNSPGAEPVFKEEERVSVNPVKKRSLRECLEIREEKSRFLSVFIKTSKDVKDETREKWNKWNKTDSIMMNRLTLKRTVK